MEDNKPINSASDDVEEAEVSDIETEDIAKSDDTPKKEEPKKESVAKTIYEYSKMIVIAFALAFVITQFIIINCTVPTGSMLDTIQLKDRVIGTRLCYLWSEPERGDIVVFKYPDDSTGKTIYIKRVIGLPGDTIEIKDNRVYLNGSDTPLDEPYLNEEYLVGGSMPDFGPYTVPEGTYFMLGDHRNNSKDSRYWTITTVKKSDILGKALFTYWPISDWTWLDNDYD